MARELMLVATAIVCLAPGIHGQAHLSFAVDSRVSKISNKGCGETRLCIESPADCDPTHSACLFTSIVHNTKTSPSSLDVTLSGQSTGYIAMGFTRMPNKMPVAVFVCAQNNENNGEFFLFSMLSDNEGNLTPLKQNVNEIRGAVDGNMITCEFNIPQNDSDDDDDDDDTIKDTMLHVILGSGTANGEILGVMKTHVQSGKIDVTNPKSA